MYPVWHGVNMMLLHSLEDHVIRVVGVTDSVGSAQQHLERDVWHLGPHALQPFPRALVEEPESDVKRGATPVLQSK